MKAKANREATRDGDGKRGENEYGGGGGYANRYGKTDYGGVNRYAGYAGGGGGDGGRGHGSGFNAY